MAVLGNHDYECGQADRVTDILERHGVRVLDGTAEEVHGVGFAGAKGFAGGFGDRLLQPWGEPVLKQFVHEAAEEAIKLELGLAKLTTSTRGWCSCIMRPSWTLCWEKPRKLSHFWVPVAWRSPSTAYRATAVFHGHAHHGALEGRTRDGIPVYNVALPLLGRAVGSARADASRSDSTTGTGDMNAHAMPVNQPAQNLYRLGLQDFSDREFLFW